MDGFTDALDIVIDDNARNGFRAGDHGSRVYTYIAAVDSADTIDAGTFIWTAGMVEFADQSDFIVAFAIGCTESNRIDGNFGWVRLAYEGGTIVLKGGAINTTQGSPLIVGSGEPPSIDNPEEEDLVFDWVVIDRGEYFELGEQNQPTSGTSGKVIIPSEIGGKPVCSIGEAAFYSHDEITDVVIPETVSNIGYKAFFYCESLKSCNIPSGVTNIDESAFMETALRKVSIPEGVKYIKPYVFAWCRALTNAVWGAGVTNIGEMAFSNTALANIVIPACVDSIGSAAFGNCQNLKSASVWPWTRLIGQPFDSSCWIEYTGTITNLSRMAQDCGGDVTNIMVWIGRENFNGVTDFKVYDDYQDEIHSGSDWVSKILYYTGIAPAVSLKSGGMLEAKYTWPKIEVVSFDPGSRRITGKVIPQGGCRIASIPEMTWQLGLRRYDRPDAEGVNDWSYHPDVSGYADKETLGEFTHTIPEDDFATNRFFRLELVDW